MEKILLALACFLGTLSLATLLLGLSGLLYLPILITFGLLALSIFAVYIYLALPKIKALPRLSPSLLFILPILLVLTNALFSIFLYLPVFDEYLYHLSLPFHFLKSHHIASIPYNLYSNFPLNIEMLYIWGMLFHGLVASRLINLGLGALCALTLFALGRKLSSPKAGLNGLLIFFSFLTIVSLLPFAYNDFGLTFFCLASILCFLNWFDTEKSSWLLLMGGLCGLALGAKYIAALNCFILIALVFACNLIKRKDLRSHLRDILMPGLAALLVFSPWLIKNYIFTGNPIYPFFYHIFGGKFWDSYNQTRYFQVLQQEQGPLGEGLARYWSLPWFLTFDFSRGVPLGFTWILIFPFLLFFRKYNLKLSLLGIYTLLYFIFWSFTSMVIRFLLPALAVFSLLGGIFLQKISNQWIRGGMIALLVLSIILNVSLCWFNYDLSLKWKIEDVNNYHSAMEYANHHLPPSARLLFVGEVRSYGFKSDLLAPTMFDLNVTELMLERSRDLNQFADNLRKERINYIFFYPYGLNWLQKTFGYFRNDHQLLRFIAFLSSPHVEKVHRAGDYYFYRLRKT
jgi:hypothetical protein